MKSRTKKSHLENGNITAIKFFLWALKIILITEKRRGDLMRLACVEMANFFIWVFQFFLYNLIFKNPGIHLYSRNQIYYLFLFRKNEIFALNSLKIDLINFLSNPTHK